MQESEEQLRIGTLTPRTSSAALQLVVRAHLTRQPNHKARNVHNLLPHPNVPLPNQHPRVVHALGQSQLEHLGLQPALQKVFDLETEDVIELGFGFVEHTDADETADEGVSFEETFGV